mgnify:CR=1 FL=1
MAASSEVINGSDLFVFYSGVSIAHATSHTLSMKMATRNTSNKDSGVWETKASGRLDVTASCEGLCVYGENEFERLTNALVAREPLELDFGQKTTGSTLDETYWYASGQFIMTSFDMTAGDQANTTYSAQFEHYSGFTITNSTA